MVLLLIMMLQEVQEVGLGVVKHGVVNIREHIPYMAMNQVQVQMPRTMAFYTTGMQLLELLLREDHLVKIFVRLVGTFPQMQNGPL